MSRVPPDRRRRRRRLGTRDPNDLDLDIDLSSDAGGGGDGGAPAPSGPERGSLACNDWLEQDAWEAEEVPPSEKEACANVWDDEETEGDGASSGDRFQRSQPSDGITGDSRFCYLCMKQLSPGANPFLEYMKGLLSHVGQMDIVCLCNTVARYYKWNLFPYTQQPWGAKDVWRHLIQHTVDERAVIVDAMRKLGEYDDAFSQTAVLRDPDTGRLLPPDPISTQTHQRVLKERILYARMFSNLKAKTTVGTLASAAAGGAT